MKTFLKVVAAFIGLLAIGVGVLYVGWFRHPSPGEVCENIRGVAEKEAGSLATTITKDCESRMQPGMMGETVGYATRMKCLHKAKTLSEIKSCSSDKA